jgi:polyferredoxin
MDRKERVYLAKLAAMLAIGTPLLWRWLDAQPLGDLWTVPITAIAIGVIGLGSTMIFER